MTDPLTHYKQQTRWADGRPKDFTDAWGKDPTWKEDPSPAAAPKDPS